MPHTLPVATPPPASRSDRQGAMAAGCGSLDSLDCHTLCSCSPWLRQMRCTELMLIPLA